ncbi:MAG TPA: FAD-binding oxidoreductase [Microscillaceae bacterium]|nr:FAD-binding oxidoreductase [Microscillaceae bacterium]
MNINTNQWEKLRRQFQGELYVDFAMRALYATDASAYREMPQAVALPKTTDDILHLIRFATEHRTSLVPRTAGTSLAGQVVGHGIVTDVSKYFNQIIEINAQEGWVRVQPGIVRDDLNKALAPYGMFFAPETSTANRAMIGGMIGNNSCGSNSIVYGSTREHLLEVKGFLSDGSFVSFSSVDANDFLAKTHDNTLESYVYLTLQNILTKPENQVQIRQEFPKPNIPRRNTGYALDLLLETAPFTEGKPDFNFCKLIAGSEGTLMFITEAKLKLTPLPPPHSALICGHFNSIHESLLANLVALPFQPTACELMDHYILDCTKNNLEQQKNRFFVQGDPQAILVIELVRESEAALEEAIDDLLKALKDSGHGFHFPVLRGEDCKKVWALRKAGLGLLGNIVGDTKPVPVIEDTAVDVQELPDYIAAFNQILQKYGLSSVHYAHAGSGELHLRPILNLKTTEGNAMFRTIAEEIATLVKQYKGSLSGEHGDGRLRGEFIPRMLGEHNYALLRQVKQAFDPHNIFNPNKIIDTPPMNTALRYMPEQATPQFDTAFDFSANEGILRATEQCNGSGDCRKTHLAGGTMCPSYMATRNEKDTTRARANILREVLTNTQEENPFAHPAIGEVMDLCLSCKGCKSECPSNVDVAKLKAEYLYQSYKKTGVPWRSRLIAQFSKSQRLASLMPGLYNYFITQPFTASLLKKIAGFAPQRSLPHIASNTLRKWFAKHKRTQTKQSFPHKVYFFCDEFTQYNDVAIGQKAILLLEALGYEVVMPKHAESGRTYLSKGLLEEARTLAHQNIELFKDLITEQTPLIGLEPSAILTFRDEYIGLTRGQTQEQAQDLAQHVYTFEEFLAKEVDKGHITAESFSQEAKLVKVHGHCYQKALSSLTPTKKILSLPAQYEVHFINSGCCGMAGSFGYEAEHYQLSMQIGELVLFPAVRQQPANVLICAAGTSCRHQIKDGTQREALHPAEILYNALKNKPEQKNKQVVLNR